MKKSLTVVGALIVVLLIIGGVARWVATNEQQPGQPGQIGQPGEGQLPPEAEGPQQPDWCPSVEFIAAPGTWESRADDDPINPTANPASFMLTITQPLQQRYVPDDVKVWTLPYTAQFRNRGSMEEMTYDESRNEGTSTLRGELVHMHEQCPLTDFILTGFSQGAVIVGDLANQIGTVNAPIPAERVRGVALIADGRREPGVGQVAGPEVAGVGAEISLEGIQPVVGLVTPGATMRGPRQGGFGSLDDRTFEICAHNDHICDAPLGVNNAVERAQALVANGGIHAQYATNPDVFPGETTSQWVVGWAENLIGH